MNFIKLLKIGAEAIPLAEEVFKEAEPLVETVIHQGEEIGKEVGVFFSDAKKAFETVKTSGIAGTETGEHAATAVDDVTTIWANLKEAVGGDVQKLMQVWPAMEMQFKTLTAQLAGGNDVTAQPQH